MMISMTKDRFVKRMMHDVILRQMQEKESERVINAYISESITKRQHKFHRRDPKRSLKA